MAVNIRITITPEIEKALAKLRLITAGTLNTTELIKYAIGKAATLETSYEEIANSITELRLQQAKKELENDEYITIKPGGSTKLKDIVK